MIMTESELLNQVYYLSLVMSRIIGMFLIAPIFGSRIILRRVKVGLILLLAMILMPIIPTGHLSWPVDLWLFGGQLIREVTVGLIIGFTLLITFTTIQLAGEFIDKRMGFFLASIMSPQLGAQAPIIGQFKNIMAILIFFVVGGDQKLLQLLAKSFKLIKLGQFSGSSEIFAPLLRIVGDLFPLALQLALPIMGSLFLIDIALGILARTVPQMNVFIVGLPIKIMAGMTLLFIILPNYIEVFKRFFTDGFHKIHDILNLMG